jgi:hypothetical protein
MVEAELVGYLYVSTKPVLLTRTQEMGKALLGYWEKVAERVV